MVRDDSVVFAVIVILRVGDSRTCLWCHTFGRRSGAPRRLSTVVGTIIAGSIRIIRIMMSVAVIVLVRSSHAIPSRGEMTVIVENVRWLILRPKVLICRTEIVNNVWQVVPVSNALMLIEGPRVCNPLCTGTSPGTNTSTDSNVSRWHIDGVSIAVRRWDVEDWPLVRARSVTGKLWSVHHDGKALWHHSINSPRCTVMNSKTGVTRE